MPTGSGTGTKKSRDRSVSNFNTIPEGISSECRDIVKQTTNNDFLSWTLSNKASFSLLCGSDFLLPVLTAFYAMSKSGLDQRLA